MPGSLSFRRSALAGLIGVAILGSASVRAQDRPPDNATAARIQDGADKVQAGKLLDAVEQFQRVLDTAGDELVPVGPHQLTRARWVVHGHIARLPSDGVRLYRQRVDGQAARRLDEAKKAGDDAGLERLLADMCSARATEEAILELARRAFERGEFDAAEHYWRMLLLPAADDDRLLHYPGPNTDTAAVLAHLILVKLFRGERDEAKADLELFRQKHGVASGLLAGKTGKYVDQLTELFKDRAKTTLPRPADEPGWPTFAGSPARTGTLRTRLPYFWPDVPAWRTPLPLLRGNRFDEAPADPLHRRALAFHPVIADGRAFVADGARVFAIDLMTGTMTRAAQPAGGQDTMIPTRQDVRHTLTTADGVLYARLGQAALKSAEPGVGGGSFVLALGGRKGATEERDALWRLDPPAAADATTHFEGTPVVHRGRLYVGFWRSGGAEALAGVACYRLDDPKAPPELAWQRIVGKAGSEPNGETRFRHELVTISGPNVVYCTDGGTVISLDAATGRPAWEYRYPRNERPAQPRYRDLCPPLADGGRLYAAPADTDRLLCLDAFTGRLIWEREGVEVIHLLGVAKGHLIATFGGPTRGIRGLNLQTGADSGPAGWTIHDDAGEQTFGRGLVTEDVVVWPTMHGLQFLDPADGMQLRLPIPAPTLRLSDGTALPSETPGPFGNLCYADGVLVVTTATEVWGYVSETRKLAERRKAVEDDPNNPVLHADLAQSLIDAAEFAEAKEEAAKAGEANERLRWLLAERVIRDVGRERAKRLYEELAKGDGSFAAAAAVRLAEMTENPAEMLHAWRAVFASPGTVRDEHGVPWPARTYAELHSRELLSMRGIEAPGNDPAGDERKTTPIVPSPFGVRTTLRRIDEPALRILHSSQHGIIAAGERLYIFPGDGALRLHGRPESASFDGSLVMVGGPTALCSLSATDGRVRWELDYRPDGPILSRIDRLAIPAGSGCDGPPHLEGVRLGAESAAFIYGGNLVRLTPSEGTGEVVSAASGQPAVVCRYYSGLADMAQTADGRMLVRRPGAPTAQEYPCTRKPWKDPPKAVGPDRYLVPDDGAVFLFDAKAGKELARYTLPGPDSLTGELPRFRVHDRDALLLMDRNYGVELDRLGVDDLKRAWDRSPLLVGRTLDDVAVLEDHLLTSADGLLAAHSWNDGSLLWEVPLPDVPHTRWKLTVSPQGLLVHPAEAILCNPHFDAVGEFRRAGWDRAGLLRAASKSYDVWTARELPVLVIDPADGQLIQRLTFPAAGPAAGVAVTPKGVVVVTGKSSWTLTAK